MQQRLPAHPVGRQSVNVVLNQRDTDSALSFTHLTGEIRPVFGFVAGTSRYQPFQARCD
jgi:hypothetical protein